MRASGPLYDSASSSSARGRVSVSSGSDAGGGLESLLYSTARMSRQRIRYDQVLFVERQQGDISILAADPLRFFAASASQRSAISTARTEGLVARAWGFNDARSGTRPPANFPATDEPHEAWYLSYIRSVGGITF